MTDTGGVRASDVARALGDADPEARRLAVQALPALRGPDAARLMARALADVEWRVRKEAARIAPEIEPRDAVLDALTSALAESEDIGLRNAAVEALVAVGASALPAVIRRLAVLDADGRKLLAEVLGSIADARSVTALVGLLRDPDPNVRVSAAEGLGTAGLSGAAERELAIGALSRSLESDDAMATLATLDALARLDAKLPWNVLEPLIAQPVLRRQALLVAAAAARSGDEASLLALAFAVGDHASSVAHEAALALATCVSSSTLHEDARVRVRDALRSSPRGALHLRQIAGGKDDRRARAAALVVLGAAGDRVDVRRLVEAVSDEELTEGAVVGLELFGEAHADEMLAALGDGSPRARAAVLGLVSRLVRVAPPSLLAGLRREVHGQAPEVVRAALVGIGAHGDELDLPALVTLTRASDDDVAWAAVSALRLVARRAPAAARALVCAISPDGEDAVAGCALVVSPDEKGLAFLEHVLTHTDPRARRVAVETLGAAGESRTEELLAFALADEEREVRLAAVRALGKSGRAEPLFALVSTSDDVELVVTALRALGEVDPARGFLAACPLLTHHDPALACAGVEAVDRFAEGSVREDALFQALAHPDLEVTKFVLTSLSKTPDARALARLGTALDHESADIRRLASDLLGSSKEPTAAALLRARLELEHEPLVRDALSRALSVRPSSGFEDG